MRNLRGLESLIVRVYRRWTTLRGAGRDQFYDNVDRLLEHLNDVHWEQGEDGGISSSSGGLQVSRDLTLRFVDSQLEEEIKRSAWFIEKADCTVVQSM